MILRHALTTATALAATLSLAVPAAHADQRTFHDPAGDTNPAGTHGGDLRTISVNAGTQSLKVRVSGVRLTGLTIYLDTRKNPDGGPDFDVSWSPGNIPVSLFSHQGWDVSSFKRCAGLSVDHKGGALLFTVPRSCLAHQHVEPTYVAANVTSDADQRYPRDVWPARRTLSPRVDFNGAAPLRARVAR